MSCHPTIVHHNLSKGAITTSISSKDALTSILWPLFIDLSRASSFALLRSDAACYYQPLDRTLKFITGAALKQLRPSAKPTCETIPPQLDTRAVISRNRLVQLSAFVGQPQGLALRLATAPHCLILKSSSLAVGRSSMKSPLLNTLSRGGPCRENQYLQISSKRSKDMALILSTLFSTGRLSGVISSSPSVGHAPRRWVTPRLMNRTKIPFLNGCQCRFCISLEKTARSGAWRRRCIVDGQ